MKRVCKSLFAAAAFPVQDQGKIDVNQPRRTLDYTLQLRIAPGEFFQVIRGRFGPGVTSPMGKLG
jgi:hypothetical protein